MSTETWLAVWQAVMIAGMAAFYLVAIAVIPLGARDVLRLFSRLDNSGRGEGEDNPP